MSLKRRSSQTHARHPHLCPCGRKVYGNGGWSSHKRSCPVYLSRKAPFMTYTHTWYTCPKHSFVPRIDSISGREVVCTECGVPGDLSEATGEVYWPAT